MSQSMGSQSDVAFWSDRKMIRMLLHRHMYELHSARLLSEYFIVTTNEHLNYVHKILIGKCLHITIIS